jgi:hypothetical protein
MICNDENSTNEELIDIMKELNIPEHYINQAIALRESSFAELTVGCVELNADQELVIVDMVTAMLNKS